MKRWLKRKLEKLLYEDNQPVAVGVSKVSTREVNADPILNFRVYSAENGTIIEFNKYDRVKDRSECHMYIVGKDEDIAEKVGKCLNLELLRWNN